MANVGFKIGPQSAVDKLLLLGTNANAVEGSFYLTSDTHRLYIGNADHSLSPINQGVLTVSTINQLPQASKAEETGSFYYVAEGNILCVAQGGKWTQINTPGTIKSLEQTIVLSDNEASIITAIASESAGSDSNEKSSYITLAGGNGITLSADQDKLVINGESLDFTTSTGEQSPNSAKVSLTGANGEEKAGFTLIGGKNVTITNKNGLVTISSVGGTEGPVITEDADTRPTKFEVTNKDNGFSFDFSTEQYDALTGVSKDNTGKTVSATFNPTLSIGEKEVNFTGGNAALDDLVYSKEEIEKKLQNLNSMVYRGTIGSEGSVGNRVEIDGQGGVTNILLGGISVPFSIGDTVLAAEDILVDGYVAVEKGSLLIANGVEGDNGYIQSGLFFDVVSGSVKDTTYSLTTKDDLLGIGLKEKFNSAAPMDGSLGLIAGTMTKIEKSGTLKDVKLTVSHQEVASPTVTTDDPVSFSASKRNSEFTAITGITTNSTGHITGYKTGKLNLGKITSQNDFSLYLEKKNGNYIASFTPTVTTTSSLNGTLESAAIDGTPLELCSKSLNIVKAENRNTGIQIDMVWDVFS